MPRKHGGRRTGTPGVAYPQRTDLNQPVQVAAGQPYGARQEQVAAQKAVPLPAAPPVPVPPPSPAPGSFGSFLRPTEKPSEPLTAGLPFGAGPGTEAVAGPWGGLSDDDRIVAELKGLYAADPNPDVLRLIEAAQRRTRAVL